MFLARWEKAVNTKTSPSRCEYCGKELPTKEFSFMGIKPRVVTLPCDCAEAREAIRREEEEIERAERIRVFSEKWRRVGVPKAFEHVEADFELAKPLFRGNSLYITGRNGRGKTYAACRAAKAFLARNTRKDEDGIMGCWTTAVFITAQDMFSRLRTSWDRWDQTEEDVFQRWAGVGLLVLDDLGKGVPSEWAAENVFRLVDARWSNGRPMVITSQYAMPELADRYERAGDETMEALLSRLMGWCGGYGVRIDGDDRRIAGVV